MGLKLVTTPVAIGELNLPKPTLTAVLWLPNTSYTNPRRGDQFLKHDIPLIVLQSIWGKLRGPVKRPAGAFSGSTWADKYSHRTPAVTDKRLNRHVSIAYRPNAWFRRVFT